MNSGEEDNQWKQSLRVIDFTGSDLQQVFDAAAPGLRGLIQEKNIEVIIALERRMCFFALALQDHFSEQSVVWAVPELMRDEYYKRDVIQNIIDTGKVNISSVLILDEVVERGNHILQVRNSLQDLLFSRIYSAALENCIPPGVQIKNIETFSHPEYPLLGRIGSWAGHFFLPDDASKGLYGMRLKEENKDEFLIVQKNISRMFGEALQENI